MKKIICALVLLCAVLVVCTACEENGFSKDLDRRVFEYILRDTKKEDVEIRELDAYSHEGYCYYHVKYTLDEDGETDTWNVVYCGSRYGSVTMYYNLNWENDSIVFPMKDDFYDAVEYGAHKQYTAEEIQRCVDAYFNKK